MAFTGNFMCTSFKQELLVGGHNFTTGGDVFKIALFGPYRFCLCPIGVLQISKKGHHGNFSLLYLLFQSIINSLQY